MEIDLSWNKFDDQSALAFVNAIIQNYDDNKITDKIMTCIDFSFCQISQSCEKQIDELIKQSGKAVICNIDILD